MKFKLFIALLVFCLAFSTSYASFPVKRSVNSEKNTNIGVSSSDEEVTYTAITTRAGQDLTVGILLWFFLGWAAGHRWYYGKPVGWNILFIVTGGGFLIWWIIDLVNMIEGNF